MEILEKLGLKKSKEIKKEETLEEWKNRVINDFDDKGEVYPYNVYFETYCIKCYRFKLDKCFNKKGSIDIQTILDCIKVRSYLESKENIIEYKQVFKEQLERIE